MRRTLLTSAIALAALTAAPPAWAAPLSPEGILRAREHLTYSGVLTITQPTALGPKTQRVRITQGEGTKQRQEFLGPRGDVVDLVVCDGNIRWHWAARTKAVKLAPMDAEGSLKQRLGLVRDNYRFRVLGQLRHLGRVVLLAQFTPRHPGNLTHRLWVDQGTQLPLVVERRAPDGALVDRSEFTSITFAPPLSGKPFAFALPPGCKVQSQTTMLAEGDGGTPPPRGLAWRPEPPRDLPAGYRLLHWQYFLDHRKVPTFAWRFHDGLNLLSCFATDARSAPAAPTGSRPVRIGTGAGYAIEHGAKRMLAWAAGPTAYTLVGHLPAEALEQVAASTR
jgi:outer membrane lipoprotein-sorting protein